MRKWLAKYFNFMNGRHPWNSQKLLFHEHFCLMVPGRHYFICSCCILSPCSLFPNSIIMPSNDHQFPVDYCQAILGEGVYSTGCNCYWYYIRSYIYIIYTHIIFWCTTGHSVDHIEPPLLHQVYSGDGRPPPHFSQVIL